LVGKAERVPLLALLPLPYDPKCCSYSMNSGLEHADARKRMEKILRGFLIPNEFESQVA